MPVISSGGADTDSTNPAPRSVDVIGREISHYRILDRLGGGGMGVVYKAEDTSLGRIVALKFLNTELLANESLRKRFLREARAASLIDHPNVCHVYEVGEAEDGRAFMAMSYCEGRSLRDVIQSGPMPPREAFGIAFGIAQGLWAAHKRNIVHRDIKPANVILTDDGFVRIVDFGLALLIGESNVTSSAVTVGTVAYMSPEQTSGSHVAPNTDIWSLGVTLYQTLTGHLPFRGDVNAALLYSIVHEPYETLPNSVPLPVARVVGRCLEKDPAQRYQTVEEVLVDMVKAAEALGWESSVASATIRPIIDDARRARLLRRIATFAAALIFVAGAGYAVYWYTHRKPPLFTTKMRVAVLPFKNRLGPSHDAFVAGLGEHTTRLLEATRSESPSLWTVPYSRVVKAQLPEPATAARTFGVNRIITGEVQRYGASARVTLELRNADNLRVVKKASLDFDPSRPFKLLDELATKVGGMTSISSDDWSSSFRPSRGEAVRPYLIGMGLLVPSADPARGFDAVTLNLAQAELDSCLGFDNAFPAGTRAAGDAALLRFQYGLDNKAIDRARNDAIKLSRTRSEADGFVLLGDVARVAGQPDSAIVSYRRALRADSGQYLATYWLASLLADRSRVAEAESTYLNLAAAKPDFFAVFLQQGNFYFGQDRLADASTAWARSHALAPRDALTLSNLGVIHTRRNEFPQAREMFLEAFRIQPGCESCNNVATTLYFEHKFEEAARYFEFAVQYCDTNDCATWGNLASALYWTDGKRESSRPIYSHAIRKALAGLAAHPGDGQLTSFLIDYYAMSGDTLRARQTIDNAARLLEEHPRVMFSAASAYEQFGQRELALHHLANAVRHDFPLALVENEPLLEELRKDPRYKEIVAPEAAADRAQAASHDSH